METYFSVRPEVPYSLIMHRLGYHNLSTGLSDEEQLRYKSLIEEYTGLLLPDVTFDLLDITERRDGAVSCGAVTIKGNSALALLAKSAKVLLCASTVKSAAELTQKAFEQGRGDLAVVIDAVAAICADGGLDWIGRLVSSRLTRRRAALTMRFSPGYGDVPISVQREIHKALELERLGVTLTGAGMLIPEKSVLSFQGVEFG
jgi:hypothetical protein